MKRIKLMWYWHPRTWRAQWGPCVGYLYRWSIQIGPLEVLWRDTRTLAEIQRDRQRRR